MAVDTRSRRQTVLGDASVSIDLHIVQKIMAQHNATIDDLLGRHMLWCPAIISIPMPSDVMRATILLNDQRTFTVQTKFEGFKAVTTVTERKL